MFVFFATLGPDAPPPPSSDEAEVRVWVERARSGDRHAAGWLYQQHVHRLQRAVRPMCGPDTEDVVHESFVRALGHLDRYEPRAHSRFVSWLMTIAMNEARKHLRSRKWLRMSEPSHFEDEPDTAARPDESSERAQTRGALLSALETLSEQDRNVLCLRYGAELTSGEVAAIVGLTEANVRKICERRSPELSKRIEEALSAKEAS